MDQKTQLELSILKAQAKTLEKQVDYQLEQLEDTRRALMLTNARIAALKNSYTPIYSLSNELWVYIVKLAQQLPLVSKLSPEIVMSRVSSPWRDTVTSAPTLWTHIGSEDITKSLPTEYLETYLRRSQSCLLTIVLSLRLGLSEYGRHRLAQLVRHVDRFEAVTLTYNEETYPIFSEAFQSLHAPKLKTLRIRWRNDFQTISVFTGGAPMLSMLDLNNCVLDESSSLYSSLTTLRWVSSETLYSESFKRSISQMTRLTKLELFVDDLCDIVEAEPLPLDIPSLQSLVLNFSAYGAKHISWKVFSTIPPCIESLVMAHCHGDQIIHMLNDHGPRLRTLYPNLDSLAFVNDRKYLSCACDASYMPSITADAVYSFSSISHLSFINICHQDIVLRMLLRGVELIQPTSPETFSWSRLRSVTMSPLLDTTAIRDVFESRRTCGYPISTLRVVADDFSRLEELSSEDRAEIPPLEIFDETRMLDSLICIYSDSY